MWFSLCLVAHGWFYQPGEPHFKCAKDLIRYQRCRGSIFVFPEFLFIPSLICRDADLFLFAFESYSGLDMQRQFPEKL
jgi:hypothetical protein